MKVGILTFHRASNYGAVLQCYALQKKLECLGYDICVIDYRQPATESGYQPFHWKHIWNNRLHPGNIYRYLRKYGFRKKVYKSFHKFRTQYLHLTKQCNQLSIPQDIDIYLLGSDQIWSLICTEGFDPVFWGLFKHPSTSKICGYAISTNIASIESIDKDILRNSINKFASLSVREKTIKEELEKYISTPIRVDIDPTLLLSSHNWDELTDDSWGKRGDYIVVYQARHLPGRESLLYNKACALASRIGNTDIIDLSTCNYTPQEFVSIIKHARYVLTSSFHGTVFGLIFHRPMAVFKLNDGHDSRCVDLLKSVGMENMLKDISWIPILAECNYNLFDERLAKLQQDSIDYLKSLKNIL